MAEERRNFRFTQLWMEAQPAVAAYLTAVGAGAGGAGPDDLLQEIALAIFERFDSFDPRRPFTAWALGVARNKLLMRWRAEGRSPVVARDPEFLEALGRVAAELSDLPDPRQQAMRECVGQLEGRSWELIRMRYDAGLTPRQIGEQLKLTATHVRVVLTRVRAALRDCIKRRVAAAGGSLP